MCRHKKNLASITNRSQSTQIYNVQIRSNIYKKNTKLNNYFKIAVIYMSLGVKVSLVFIYVLELVHVQNIVLLLPTTGTVSSIKALYYRKL